MVKVLQPGFYTTIQDLGRFDYQSIGVPISGAMDQIASNCANAILGNDNNCAVLEITLVGPKLEFNCNTIVSITGAEFNVQLNDKDIRLYKAINVKKGDIITFGKLNKGYRAYLAVSGGFSSNLVLNSRSMYQGITKVNHIKKGDILNIIANERKNHTFSSIKFNCDYFKNQAIEVFKGPEFNKLNNEQKQKLFNHEFIISKDNNRMAYQLKDLIVNNLNEIITSLVLPGTVQLTPSGKLIILMRDCQTTGGYPRVLQLTETSISVLTQKMVNDKVQFKLKDLS